LKSCSHLSAESKHQSLLPGALSSLDIRTVKRPSQLGLASAKKSNCIANVSPPIALCDIILSLPCGEQRSRIRSVTYWQATLAILAALSVSMALAEDFKTTNGKEYKDATITRVEGDGIVIRTKTGISKVYFTELSKDVQERFHPRPSPTKTVAAQRERESIKKTGWAAAVANPIAFIVVVVAGAIIIAGVVFAIVRSRSMTSNDSSEV
jgi:hypothetical protein